MQDFINFGNKSDKIYHHGYQRFYPRELESFRNKKIGVIEIGIDAGSSLPLWTQFFPNAYIYGIDIGKEMSAEKFTVFKGDQSSRGDLERIATKFTEDYPVHFINDDGSHIPEHQLISFDHLFDNVLKDGGVYIIEDIETSYWKRNGLYGYSTNYGVNHPNSLIEKFKLLVDYVNIEFLSDHDKKILKEKTSFLSEKTKGAISSINFCQNCIIIRKKEEYEYAYNNRIYRFKQNI